ncbi:hypothetical protein [Proteus mirabilis]|uniref:hypothetical protein n=1 Tax=Proteus mirabilis TaxID=584 RepID=UPI000ACEFAFD|nr:hypothetical protein [Proteus mirabilis]
MRTLTQLKPNTLTRLYALFLLFMAISLFLYAYSYFDTWLESKKMPLTTRLISLHLKLKITAITLTNYSSYQTKLMIQPSFCL